MFCYVQTGYLPGDSRNIENTIKPNTAAITKSAINIPRQFLWPGDDAANSWISQLKNIVIHFTNRVYFLSRDNRIIDYQSSFLPFEIRRKIFMIYFIHLIFSNKIYFFGWRSYDSRFFDIRFHCETFMEYVLEFTTFHETLFK